MHCTSRKHFSNYLAQLILYGQFGTILPLFYYSNVQYTSTAYEQVFKSYFSNLTEDISIDFYNLYHNSEPRSSLMEQRKDSEADQERINHNRKYWYWWYI